MSPLETNNGRAVVPEWTDALGTRLGQLPLSSWDHEQTKCSPVGGQEFRGRIEFGALGETVLARVTTASPHRMIFTLRPSSAPPPLVLMFQIAGACSVVQPNSSFTLRADDWCLLDTTPHLDISSFSPHNENLSLRLERPSDPELLSLIARGTGHRWRGATGVSRILETTVRETFRQMNTLRHASDSGLERGIAAIAWHAMREQLEAPVDAGHDAYQRSQIKAFIEAHLDDPELSVESIAQACGMSARSVHRAFESEPGGSVSNHIWMRRLARCADELRDPVRAHRPITELCFAWGFNSSSHFSRLFKEQFGVTPREYRDSSVRQQAPSPAVAAELS